MMPTDDMIDIWLYVNRQGKLLEIPACISKKKPSKWTYAISALDRDNYTYIQEVAREPGMIFNNSVWFKKKDFTKAKEMFVTSYIELCDGLKHQHDVAENEMLLMSSQEEEKEC